MFTQELKELYALTEIDRIGKEYYNQTGEYLSGKVIDKNMILHADFTATGAAQVMEEFLQKNIPFDGVFSNDEMALGVHRTLLSKNIAIPSDVSLAGCDNLPLGQMLYPALSTVDLDYGVLADEAIKFILQSEKVFKPCRRLIQPRLLIRESTRSGNICRQEPSFNPNR